MPSNRILARFIISAVCTALLGLSAAVAYEQGSYLIIDVVEKKAETTNKVGALSVEKKYFTATAKPKPVINTEANSSGLLTGLKQQTTGDKTAYTGSFSDVTVIPKTSSFEADTVNADFSFVSESTDSVFGE